MGGYGFWPQALATAWAEFDARFEPQFRHGVIRSPRGISLIAFQTLTELGSLKRRVLGHVAFWRFLDNIILPIISEVLLRLNERVGRQYTDPLKARQTSIWNTVGYPKLPLHVIFQYKGDSVGL